MTKEQAIEALENYFNTEGKHKFPTLEKTIEINGILYNPFQLGQIAYPEKENPLD